jgi:putative redox protein
MDVMECRYKEDFSVECLSLQTKATLATDAPKENGGKGLLFSPTDLLALSLGSCILTLMAMKAASLKVDMGGCRCFIKKAMKPAPARMLDRIEVEIFCPVSFSKEIEDKLIHAAKTCPVKNSLHPDIEQVLTFHLGATP